jgi:hypothetical protein
LANNSVRGPGFSNVASESHVVTFHPSRPSIQDPTTLKQLGCAPLFTRDGISLQDAGGGSARFAREFPLRAARPARAPSLAQLRRGVPEAELAAPSEPALPRLPRRATQWCARARAASARRPRPRCLVCSPGTAASAVWARPRLLAQDPSQPSRASS